MDIWQLFQSGKEPGDRGTQPNDKVPIVVQEGIKPKHKDMLFSPTLKVKDNKVYTDFHLEAN